MRRRLALVRCGGPARLFAHRRLALLLLVALLGAPSLARADAVERSLMDARSLTQRGQHAQAAQLYERLLQKYPNDMRIMNDYSTNLIVLRRFPEAEALLKRMVAAQPANETYPRLIEKIHHLGGRHKDAVLDCVAIATQFPSQSEWARTEIGTLCQGDSTLTGTALAALKAAAVKNPKRVDLRGMAAEVAFQSGHSEEAIAEARAADASGKKNGELLFGLMGRARATGKRGVALTLGEELRKNYPDAPYRAKLLLLLGDLYAETKQPQLALAAYQEAAAKPGAPEALQGRLQSGRIYQTELHDYTSALAQYAAVDKKSLSADDRESLLLYQADCFLRMGDFSGAAAAYDEMALSSTDSDGKERAAFEKAELLLYQGKAQDAAAEYMALTQKFPTGRLVDEEIERVFLVNENMDDPPELLQRYGEAEYRARIGDADGAIARLQKIATENPKAEIVDDARFRIAVLLAESGRGLEGAQAFHALAVAMPESKYAPRSYRRAGDLYREAGKPEQAIQEYQALFSQYPQSLDADEVRQAAEELRKKVGS